MKRKQPLTRRAYQRRFVCNTVLCLALAAVLWMINGCPLPQTMALRRLERQMLLEHSTIVLETDAPYLTPVPFRGQRNESAYVQHVCRKVAEIYGLSEAETDARTTQNACELFGLESAGKGISL